MKATDAGQWLARPFGMFVHFGLYSIPAGVWNGEVVTRGYSEQILSHGYLPQGDYEALMESFSIEHFDADAVVRTAKRAGMSSLVVTAKHHDGFCLFDTATTEYSSVHSACRRDIVRELSDACRKHSLAFGIYFSWIDWHFPQAAAISPHNSDRITPAHQELNIAQLSELLTSYGEVSELWLDMGAPDLQQSQEIRTLVNIMQDSCMINGRIWNDCHDFITMGDNELPSVALDVPWQTPASIYRETWGYRSWQERGDAQEKARELYHSAREVIAAGGNYLLNIGLMGDGAVHPFELEVLEGIGELVRTGPFARDAEFLKPPVTGIDNPGCSLDQPLVVHRYTGEDYYSNRPVPTGLLWRISLAEERNLTFRWQTKEPLPHEMKIILEIDGYSLSASLQKGRSGDTLVTAYPLTKGIHDISIRTPGPPLQRPPLAVQDITLILEESRDSSL